MSLFPVLESAFEGIALLEPESWRVAYINPTLRKWLGIPPTRESTLNLHDMLIADGGGSLRDRIDSAWRHSDFEATIHAQLVWAQITSMRVTLRLCRLSLAERPLLGLMMHPAPGMPHGLEAKPEHRDSLTGLPDRAYLFERLTALMRGQRSRHRQFAVLFVDLDNFKQVNDSHGHLVGDRVLSAVAGRLTDSVRDGDCVVRYGGDEFVVLVENVATPSEIEPLVRRIQSLMEQGISLDERNFSLRASIGAALPGPEHHTPEDILIAADRAMYAAKRSNS